MKPVRNPQADPEDHLKPLPEIWTDHEKTYSPFLGSQQNRTTKETPGSQSQMTPAQQRQRMAAHGSAWRHMATHRST